MKTCKKIIIVGILFVLLSTAAIAFFDTIQQAMIFLEAGANIKLTPNPIITLGKISLVDDPIVNDLNVTGNFTGNEIYGDISVHPDGNITIDIEAPNVHRNITGFDTTKLNGFSLQDDALVAEIDGCYKFNFWLSMSGGVNNLYESCIAVNGEHETPHAHLRLGTPGDIGGMSGGGVFCVKRGDIINLQLRNTDGIADADMFYAGMFLKRIGDFK